MEMAIINHPLVRAVNPDFPSDRYVKESHDKSIWYMIKGNIMYAPPVRALRANFGELERFSEAVNNFAIWDLNQPEEDWSTPFTLLSNALDVNRFLEHVFRMPMGTYVAVDIECCHVGWDNNRILCIGFYFDDDTCFIINDFTNIADINTIFALDNLIFIWHNGKFDCGRLYYSLGIEARVDEDTMLMHYVGINEKKGTHGLKLLAPLYLQAPQWDDELEDYKHKYCRQHKIKVSDFTYDMIPLDVLYPYLAMDTRATLKLFFKFRDMMRPESITAYRMIIRASNAYKLMETNGMAIDEDYLNKLHIEMINDIQEAEDILEETTSKYWNPQQYALETGSKVPDKFFNQKSPKQLKWLLEKATGTRLDKTDKDALEKLKQKFPTLDVLDALLTLRKHNKYLDTYVLGIRKAECKDGRVHCSYNLHGTETGRLSCSEPNMQNIPRDKKIKNIFKAAPGCKLVQLDYSQAELRVLAYLSKDPFLTKVYQDGRDLHDAIATKMFGPDFTKEERVMAKTINFGIAYGRGPGSLCETFGISMMAAKKLIEDWYAPMPKVREWITNQRNAPHRGVVPTTVFGRQRHFVITPDNHNAISNEAVNFPIQSIASDLTLMSVCEITDTLKQRGLAEDARIVATVHDSIIFEVTDKDEIVDAVANIGKSIMESQSSKLPDCEVPIKSDVEVGYTWGGLSSWEPAV
jgi:DNA polymerase I-like protein with 3'-5' exonuclease and polymerase domains